MIDVTEEFPELIHTQQDAEMKALKERSARLQAVLREMEDHQVKMLALQAEAQYLQYEIHETLCSRKMMRRTIKDSKKP